jgi:hypothetical protein
MHFLFLNHFSTNIVVERVPCLLCLDFKQFSFNHVNSLTLLVDRENQSHFTNELRNAMVLTYDYLIYSEVIRRDHAHFVSYLFYPFFIFLYIIIIKKKIIKKNKVQPVADPTYF